MELVHRTRKASNFAPKDVISSMPDHVIINILNCLPPQDVVRTGILSRNWRFKWTMVTELLFDEKFYEFLYENLREKYYARIISRLLRCLKGAITKFSLYIQDEYFFKDVNGWVLFLSGNKIEEFTIINKHKTPLKLPILLCSFLTLKHLRLYNCCFRPTPSFCGFPNLMTLDLYQVNFRSYKCGKLLTQSPSLKILKISENCLTDEIKRVEISKLENLKVLFLPLCKLDKIPIINSSSSFQLIGTFPKLRELNLDFFNYQLSEDVSKMVATSFPCLKTLILNRIDISSRIMLSCAIELICGSPNLQTLKIIVEYKNVVPPPVLDVSEFDCSRMEHLQLRKVVLKYIRGWENEVYLIKSLLDCSSLLKKLAIHAKLSEMLGGYHGQEMFSSKISTFHRASPIAEIYLIWL